MSIVEVSKLAGVSHATVSRVINGRPNVSPESVKRVREAMQQLNYVPSAKRPGPKPKSSGVRSGTISLLFGGERPTLADSPVMALVVHAVHDALAERGFSLSLGQISGPSGLPPNVINGQVDGLFLHGPPPSPEVREQLSRYSACVWLLSQRCQRGYWGDRVSPDNYAIGATAAEYLVGRGHKRIAVVNCDPTHLGFVSRVQGFEAAARDGGVVTSTLVDADHLPLVAIRNAQTEAQFDALADQLLALDGGMPTGLFVPRDPLTIRLYRTLRARGIEPGRDIEIISCDNIPALDALDPRPTTIDVRPEEIGRRAVEQLLWQIDKRNTPMNVTSLVEPLIVPGDPVDLQG